MTGRLAGIWRHPIKAIGREALDRVDVGPEQTLPGDRRWAVLRAGAEGRRAPDEGTWAPCGNFVRAAGNPALMAITARSEADDSLVLRHPDLPELTFDPGREGDRAVAWISRLCAPPAPAPGRLVAAGSAGMTDSPWPSISLVNLASLRALSQRLGRPLEPERFRANLAVDGLGPWEEFEWIGRRLRVGTAVFEVRERITRCRATEANPATGRRDAATLDALEQGWNHADFGVYMAAVEGGSLATGDTVEALP